MDKTEHPYAQVLRWIADGELIQRMDTEGQWYHIDHKPLLAEIYDKELSPPHYRLKPSEINVNGYEVPCGIKKPFPHGDFYWIPVLSSVDMTSRLAWDSSCSDFRYLERGLCHATREAAEAHAKALLSFTTTEQP